MCIMETSMRRHCTISKNDCKKTVAMHLISVSGRKWENKCSPVLRNIFEDSITDKWLNGKYECMPHPRGWGVTECETGPNNCFAVIVPVLIGY